MKKILLSLITIFYLNSNTYSQAPSNLNVSSVNSTDAIMNWDNNGCSSNYILRYRENGNTTWNPGISITNTGGTETYNLTGLTQSKTYNWKVKCGGTWSLGTDFTTTSSCSKTINQSLTAFSPNPLTGYMQWSFDTLSITNTSICDINIRPEFIISHQDSAIEQGDFTIKWYNPIIGNWPDIPYSIDINGNAYGFWNASSADSTGINLGTGSTQQMIIKLRYTNATNNPNSNLAPFGTYTASWETFEVDNLGTQIQSLAPADTTFLDLVDCSIFTIDSTSFADNNCNGSSGGTASIHTITNGSGQYTYNWNNGQIGSTATNLVAGTYSCIVTDNNWGCSDSATFIITEPAVLGTTLTGSHITCSGSNDGTLTATATGGSGSYKFTWSPSLPPNPTQSGLLSGLYTLTVLDLVCGGTSSANFDINEPDPLQETAISIDNSSCDTNNCNGSIDLSITGGTTPYSIIWSNGDSVSLKSDLCADNYSITITDANACATFTENITLVDNLSTPSIAITTTNNSSCDTSICNGSISITENPGATPYSILWSNGSSLNTLSGLCGNSYSFTITDTNTCSITNTIAIYDSATTPNIGIASTSISCNGLSNGTAEAMILSGAGGAGNTSTLVYCASLPFFNDKSNIELVRLIGDGDSIINNTATLADQYEDYTAQYTTLSPNQTYSLDLSMGVYNNNTGSSWSAGAKAFIDWNIDGDFDDAGEEIGTISNIVTSTPNLSTLTFTVPNYGIYGATRLRVVSQYNNDAFGPCEAAAAPTYTPYYGATEDYSIVINGTTPATYLWSTGDTTSQIANLSAGTYTCTVTDTNGCFAIDSVSITEPTIISTLESTTNVLCNGENNGTVSLAILGGNAPYTINWGTADTNNLSAGTHNYTVTDNNGCTFSDSININSPNALSNTHTSVNVNCNGTTNGSIDITPAGGVSPYTFAWDNGAITEDLTAISAGQYIVTITDANNCTFNDTIIITEPTLLYSSFTQTNVSCYGFNDGSATVSFFGGVTDYILSWDTLTYPLTGGFSVFSTPVGVPAGIYPYMVTDNNGCTHADTIIITQPDSIYTTPTLINVSCNGLSDGTAILNILGGTSPYLENWGASDSTALNSGHHTFTITDANGCIANDSILITEPLALTASENISNVSCNGGNDGNVTLIISGGTSPYLENWNGYDSTALAIGSYTYTVTDANACTYTNTISITEPNALTAIATTTDVLCNGDSTGTATLTINGGTPNYSETWNGASPFNLLANMYTFTVTDANGCSFSNSVIINEPTPLISSINPTDLTSCLVANGSIDLTVNGGVGLYTYLWNNNDTTEDITNLSAGNYTVTISDTNGCTATNSASVNQPSNGLSLSLISPDYNGYNISCYNGNNGTITANTTGGLGNLAFAWSTNDTLQNLNNLTAGNYSLMITDSVGCSLTDSITLTEPSQLSSIYTSTDASCFGVSDGGAMVNFSGGIQDYTLIWGTYTYPLIGGISTFITPIGVPAGIYPYTVTDMNGCSHSDTITINQPDSLYTSLIISDYNGNNISCNGFADGSIDIQANGGTTSYTYYFNGALITNTTISGLVAGTYTDSIIDNNGCVFTETITLTEPTLLSNLLSTSNMSCNGICDGAINTQVNGGTAPYSFLWNNSFTTSNLDSLCVGNYALNITDNNGCILTDSAVITEPSAIVISLDSSANVTIYGGNDGALFTTTYGGVNSFTHLWAGPAGFSASTLNINNLIAGTYYLTTTDSTLCSVTDSFEITQPPSLTAYLDSTISLGCNGICTGELYITADGGDSVYTYLWFGPNGYTSTNEDIDSLCAGTYTLELSDTTNTVTLYFEVLEPTPVTIVSIADTAICYKGTAQANAYVYGGNYPYQTLWSNGSTNTSTILPAGIHFVSITDANGCVANDSVTVHQADSISINTSIVNVSCYGLQDGEITLTITNGGTAPFQYSANNGINYQTSNTFYNLAAGTADYLVSDANGCSNAITAIINQPEELGCIINTTNASCYGECDGTATASVNGGTAPYTYDWGGANPNNLCAGLYNLVVTDINGCLTASSTTISEPNPVIVNIWQNGNTIEATPDFINYQWYDANGNPINGAINDTFIPTIQGEYSVEVVDTNGCIATSYSILILIDFIGESESELTIYPNPTKGNLTIKSTEELTSISVLNSLGNQLIFIDNNIAFEKQTSIDLSTFAKGIYFIQIELNNQLINHRIILQ